MKNFVKGFLVATLIFAVTLTGFAASKKQTIEVELNPATIYVEGELKEVDHFIYKGTTYVPLRALSEALGVEVSWDGEEKVIDLYYLEPREYSILTFAGVALTSITDMDGSLDNVFEEIKEDITRFLNDLEALDLANNHMDVDTFIELQDRRSEIEDRLYTESLNVSYRTPIYYTLEVLDNIEMALIRSRHGENPERIRNNLEKAKEYVEFLSVLGF
ncbi:copper amine oxidase N-terminal domain-containing protein [Tepidimicrobium xylanilyticum]|uniref:Copper amine oxidase N-terminal domain-containing protein n=1 Tax=Tepidimicrobium xylanilyticum TaxID=1123352 RepID=A0A1H3CW19_9FIRM|nr:copper amine oxidase N-terminal domain-containing protein [Tepidimicrobium xylanilyticum]SDX58412.1 Copper amine oxidase N-terminal domain-containing protein [Tepidimicrobium xylanilyticum]